MTPLCRAPDLADPATASSLDELSLWSSKFGALLLETIDVIAGGRILDLGCGAGFPAIEIAGMHGASARCVGVDTWKEALARAGLKRRVRGLDRLMFVRADAARLPFPDGAFDLLVSNLGVNNFQDPALALAEAFRVARPGARIVLATNVRGHMREFYEAFAATLTGLGLAGSLPRLAAEENHRTTPELLAGQLAAAGFRIVRVRESDFTLRYLNGAAFLGHFLTRIGFLDGWRSVPDPSDADRVFAALEKTLDERSAREGELRLSVPALCVTAEKP